MFDPQAALFSKTEPVPALLASWLDRDDEAEFVQFKRAVDLDDLSGADEPEPSA